MLRTMTAPPSRRGVTLLMTLAALTMFALVGLLALNYARDQAEVARINSTPGGGGGGEQALPSDGFGEFNSFLAGLVFDDEDTGRGLANAMRGHSLVATKYGRARFGQPDAYPVLAFAGVGTFGGPTQSPAFGGLDRRQIVNHRLFRGMTAVLDPEYNGERPLPLPPAGQPVNYTGTYFPKNAPYTYPDVKDFFLAALCPATGEVLVPSFHRPHLFGTLNPANPNWTNAQGKFLTLRPRPAEHPNFPPVAANADGTFSGDVQNLPGGFAQIQGLGAVQRNDSLWIDIGLPLITLPSGKKLKPLVAPLILDLDGRLNLSVHGNLLGETLTPAVRGHLSGEGLGPWEVSLEQLAGGNAAYAAELQALVRARGVPRTQGGRTQRAYYERYAAATELPRYAQVPWIGFTDPLALRLPGEGNARYYSDAPLFQGGYDSRNAPVAAHPSLFNPHEWPTSGANTPLVFPLSDTKVLSHRYAPPRSETDQLSFAAQAQTLLRGSFAAPGTPAVNVVNPHRADPAHTFRHLLTTYSQTTDHGGLTPGFGQGQSPFAALPPIDLNRPLADYRANPALPLSETNVTPQSAQRAQLDRQQFANDIFVRLVAAISPPGALPPGVGTLAPTGDMKLIPNMGQPERDNLRKYAQLAVNIVDYLDNDDVISPFVWDTTPGLAATDSTVFGVEKPRLVLNEGYSEVTNDPADPAFTDPLQMAQRPAHVRFWLELVNPTETPYTAPTHPFGDGSVRLKYPTHNPYKVEIVRNASGPVNVTARLRNTPADPGYPGNVTGDSGTTPLLTFDFSQAGAAQSVVPPSNGNPATGVVVCKPDVPAPPPGGPDFNPTNIPAAALTITAAGPGAANRSLTYQMPLAAVLDQAGNGIDPASGLDHHVVLLRRLANPYLPPSAGNPFVTVDVLNHVRTRDRVLLANGSRNNMPRQPRTTPTGAGYDPNTAGGAADLRPQSYGKVQPYAAWSLRDSLFPASLVLRQDPTAVGTGADGVRHTLGRANSRAAAPPQLATYTAAGTLTGNETIMTPFEWLVHLDRPVTNQIELMHVTLGKPHELTTNFLRTPPAVPGPVAKNTDTLFYSVTQMRAGDQLYRALDLLRVQPRTHQSAIGGRVPGRLNINTIQDRRVWRALFDAQTASGVNLNSFDPAFVDALWDRFVGGSRTTNMVNKTDATGVDHPCPVPGATVHDGVPGGTDRPFLPLGVAEVAAGGDTFLGGASLKDDTLLRADPSSPPGTSYLSVRDPASPLNPADSHYRRAEALRKIMNNVTTTSDTFAVWVTVGYFEVETGSEVTPPPGWPMGSGPNPQPLVPWHGRYGREYYREVPGDTRHRLFAIVDRTNVGLDPASYLAHLQNPATPPVHATVAPFHTALEGNVPAQGDELIFPAAQQGANVVVYTNGTAVPVGGTLVVGVGATQEVVSVNTVSFANGFARATLNVKTRYAHWAGENVSNVVPGNPGPQPGFDVNLDRYKPVVPYWTRLQ